MSVNIGSIVSVSPEVAIESFGDDYLVFLADNLKIYEINSFSKIILDTLNGEKRVSDVIDELLLSFAVQRCLLENDVFEIIKKFQGMGIVKMKYKLSYSEEHGAVETQYLANPEVVVKEIDEDGALLYNLDLENLRAINSTGLEIWNMLQEPVTKQLLVNQLLGIYDGASVVEIENDIDEFVQTLSRDQFIGIVLE